MRYLARALALFVSLSAASGCAHFIVQTGGSDTEGADHGSAQVPPRARTDAAVKCGDKDIYRVDVGHTAADATVMILTAGVMPPSSRIVWKCGVPCVGHREPNDEPATKRRAKTAISWLWGVLPETVTADCDRAYLARLDVSSNLGQRLITVFSLGIASPRKVTWDCARRCVPSGGFITPPESGGRPEPDEAR